MEIPFVGDDRWERTVLGSEGPVLVEFVSATCMVCRAMRPIIGRIAEEYGDRVGFYQVDVKVEEDLVWAYQVMSTPTFIAFLDTEPVGSLAGQVDETELRNLLDDAIAGDVN